MRQRYQALKKLPLGVAYGVWSGLGVTAITIIGAIIWGEPLNAIIIFGIALIITGVVLLESPPKPAADSGSDAQTA
ncbi:SMR family transporter [Adlercreutzia sp. R21]|uniref:SMR family transporter n=1 Tax=Adlercreutzia wanghongyangiae TaxID=3111451 RepID=UPI002DBCA41E|nr:SMR family transporter [Adlercreutzia sp. R21]MEC4184465.1 SMR family transporter [Adlercreutzia sp. R21]